MVGGWVRDRTLVVRSSIDGLLGLLLRRPLRPVLQLVLIARTVSVVGDIVELGILDMPACPDAMGGRGL